MRKREIRSIPAGFDTEKGPEGEDVVVPRSAQLAENLDFTKNNLKPYKSDINCEGAVGCPQKASHFVQLPGVSREGTEAYCPTHTKMASEAAKRKGRTALDIRISPITAGSVHSFKHLRAIQSEENRLHVVAGLLKSGLRGEDAQVAGFRHPGGRPVNRPEGDWPVEPSAPRMSEEEAADYNKTLAKQPKSDFADIKRPRPRKEVAKGSYEKPGPLPALGEGEGDIDYVLRLYRSGNKNWMSEANRLGIQDSQLKPHVQIIPRGFSKTSNRSKTVTIKDLNWTPKEEPLRRAITKVGEEQAEANAVESEQNTQAGKQRALEARRRKKATLPPPSGRKVLEPRRRPTDKPELQ